MHVCIYREKHSIYILTFCGFETGRKGAGYNLQKNDIAQGHDIN